MSRYLIEVDLKEDDPSEVLDWIIEYSGDEDASVTVGARGMVIAPDYAGEPTVWVDSPDGANLIAALRRSDIAPVCRDRLWSLLELVITGRVVES